jgi:hypothetical protein
MGYRPVRVFHEASNCCEGVNALPHFVPVGGMTYAYEFWRGLVLALARAELDAVVDLAGADRRGIATANHLQFT